MSRLLQFCWEVCLLLALVSRATDSFEVSNTVSPVETRTGCTVVLTCAGFGERIEWRRFGELDPLQNDNTRTHEVDVENMSVPYLISNTTLTAYPAINNERFQCFIYGSPPGGRTVSHQVLMRVKPAVVDIEPPINEQIDISSYHIGENVSIGCQVETCAEEVVVQFLKGERVVKELRNPHSSGSDGYVLKLRVTEDVIGTYACKVNTANSDASAMQVFRIVGTPQPAPPTTPPTDPTTQGGGGGGTSSTGDEDDSSSLTNVSTASPYALLLIAALLHWL